MSKKQINNEIILLRGSTEQARVQTIKKLSRDAFKLRAKKGTEQQKAKNVRKADRIAAEILSIKKVKKDEITKFALENTQNLNEILNDQEMEPLTRMMTRIANHKIYSKKIAEFKSKYPNYGEFLGPGRRKKAVLEWKERKKAKKAQNQNEEGDEIDKDDESEADGSEENIENPDTEGSEENNECPDDQSEASNDVSKDDVALSGTTDLKEESSDLNEDIEEPVKPTKPKENINAQPKETKKQKISQILKDDNVKSTQSTKGKKNKKTEEKDITKRESKDSDAENVKSVAPITTELVENEATTKGKSKNLLGKRKKAEKKGEQSVNKDTNVKKKKSDSSTVISKQAIVKKFTDIIKEEESKPEDKSDIHTDSDKSSLKIEKEVDSFFFSGDSGQNYLSVALPKTKSNEEEDEEYGNDRFNKRKFSRQQNDKFFNKVNKFQNNSNWEGQHNNDRSNGRDRPGFNKFNGKQNDRFNDRPNGRFNDRANDRFNNKFNGKSNDKFGGDRPNNKFNDRPNNKFGNDKSFKKQGKDNFESKGKEVLHPSWEAKKKQQDVLKQGFQGKKIVFGDD